MVRWEYLTLFYIDTDNEQKIETNAVLFPTSSEASSKFERSFNPWLRHCRNINWKGHCDTRSPTTDKIMPSGSDCTVEHNANVRGTSFGTNFNEGVNIDTIFE